MKTIGLDLGDARIGIATGDPMGIIATGYETYKRSGDETKDLQYIADLARTLGAGRIIIGLPINMDGTSGDRVEKSRAFGQALAAYTDTPVDYQDERLTTVMGERMLIDAGMRRDKRKQVIDKIAATIILQSYLDSHPMR